MSSPSHSIASAWSVFTEGIQHVLRSWTALNLALGNEWGGPGTREKGQALYNGIIQLFRKGEAYADELEDFFEDFFVEQLHVVVEDGSLRGVSHLLVEMSNEAKKGNFARVAQLAGETNDDMIKAALSGSVKTPSTTPKVGAEDVIHDDDEDEDGDDDDADMADSTDHQGDATMGGSSSSSTTPSLSSASQPVVDDDGWQTVPKGRRK
eukprot:TRINITY_DN16467_c0_g1_i1.p1 TRINITY_DN16467_c0_g1~~TRINITY_DN16467_c0_g1_i1.p1  ORF type:complete len:208 (+),score=50.82 TRINITY_DN16467_c0_g1_i1:194-817(+)